jgi:hypothetical protein
MNQSCSTPLLKKDEEAEIGAKKSSLDCKEIINGNEYQLRFNSSTVELKCKVHYYEKLLRKIITSFIVYKVCRC